MLNREDFEKRAGSISWEDGKNLNRVFPGRKDGTKMERLAAAITQSLIRKADYYIDLVFYNIKLKRYVLFELKTHELTHQDVGQLDMYVRMYDDLVKDDSDNPTIGILLCTNTDKTIAKYSVLHNSEQLFASKYMAYMPTEEELRRAIEEQKRFFLGQHEKGNSE